MPDFGSCSCFRLLFKARTVSTFCSQMANRSSISLASLIALRRAPANSLGWSKLASSAPAAEWSTHGPIGGEGLSRSRFAYAKLLTIIKGKPERIAKGGERPLGGIGLGTFERKLVSLPRGRGFAFPGP